jgi:hypothetical protein
MTMNTTPRRPDLMQATPPERTTIDAMIREALNELDRAEPHLRNAGMWLTTSDLPNEYRERLDAFVYDVQMAKTGTRLSNAGKWEEIDKIAAAWRTDAERMVAQLEAQTAKWDATLTAAARPPAPIADRATLEAALANARSDAKMVLDAAQDRDKDVPYRLAEMARGDDPVLAFLILGTPWPQTYMRAHGLTTAPLLWEQERAALLGGVLTEAALAAYEKLPGLPHARKAATALRTGHSFFLHDNRVYFERPDGA